MHTAAQRLWNTAAWLLIQVLNLDHLHRVE
jgi:hypothetical protein